MYCEVPKDILDQFKEHLQEGKILYICKLIVEKAKPTWRVVDAPYMLKFSKRTQVIEAKSDDTSFPKYVFSLTLIELLPQFARRTDRFLGNKTYSYNSYTILSYQKNRVYLIL
jgi:replication factor A1